METNSITYKTLAAPSESQYRVLGSRHLSFAYPVRSEAEIKDHLDRLWKDHHNATHICYAWRLGWDKSHYRINDDGEPSGTAGRPIYGQIQSFDLTNVLIAVVRYYGGTKLGTGGLIDAYKTASKLAIEEATVVENEVMDRFIILFEHAQMPAVMKLLKDLNMEKIESRFDMTCELEFRIRKSFVAGMLKSLEEIEIDTPVFIQTE